MSIATLRAIISDHPGLPQALRDFREAFLRVSEISPDSAEAEAARRDYTLKLIRAAKIDLKSALYNTLLDHDAAVAQGNEHLIETAHAGWIYLFGLAARTDLELAHGHMYTLQYDGDRAKLRKLGMDILPKAAPKAA